MIEILNSGFLGVGLVSVIGRGIKDLSGMIVMFCNDRLWVMQVFALLRTQKNLCITLHVNFTSKEKEKRILKSS